MRVWRLQVVVLGRLLGYQICQARYKESLGIQCESIDTVFGTVFNFKPPVVQSVFLGTLLFVGHLLFEFQFNVFPVRRAVCFFAERNSQGFAELFKMS